MMAITERNGQMPVEKIPYADVTWALKNDVHVTLIYHDPNGIRTTFLVSRIHIGPIPSGQYYKPWGHALVLEFSDSPFLEINGQVIPEALEPEELIKWATLVDAVSLSPHFPDGGDWVTTRCEV